MLNLAIHPVTPARWADLEALFGPRGACAGCWCMYWRLPRKQFNAQSGAGNRQALQALIEAGETPGLLAYAGEQPIGWCAIAPRSAYPPLARSRILKPVDDQPVWSVVCFFVARSFRRQGVTVELLKAAVAYARSQGAQIVEGYPVEPAQSKAPDTFVYYGLASAFRQAGFVEIARRSPTRPIMRYTCD
jgi:GNAT superfamily N-acetyltransferase